MVKYYAVLVTPKREDGVTYRITKEMVDAAPEFDSLEEANRYADLINSSDEAMWVIVPKNPIN